MKVIIVILFYQNIYYKLHRCDRITDAGIERLRSSLPGIQIIR